MQHQFFSQEQFFDQEKFFNKAPQKTSMPYPMNYPDYMWNTIILEISNNWGFARWLMYRHQEKLLKKVDHMEKIWIEFLLINKINILPYEKNNDQFLKDHFKEDMGDVTPKQ